jgi:hypothetical protein
VKRAGKASDFVDRRRGGEEQLLAPGATVTLSRDWPGSSGQPPLRAGDELTLEVGLWGLGDDARTRRPVPKSFLVRMVVRGQAPKPQVSPPQSG